MCKFTMTEQAQSKQTEAVADGETNENMVTSASTASTTVNLIELATHCIHSTLLASKPIQYLTQYKHLTGQQHKQQLDSDSATTGTGTTTDSAKLEEDAKDDDTSISLPSSSSSTAGGDTENGNNDTTQTDFETALNGILDLQSPRIQKRIKTDGTIITDADGLAQRIIYQEIHDLNPHVHVIGEESEAEMQHFLNQMSSQEKELEFEGIDDKEINTGRKRSKTSCGNKSECRNEASDEEDDFTLATLLSRIQEEMSQYSDQHQDFSSSSSSLPPSSNVDMNIDTRRVSVFVDPLDGTSSYAKGKYEFVTILVAIIVDNVPVFGVICKPFAIGTMIHQYMQTNCTVLYGGTLIGGAYVLGGEEMKRSRAWNSNRRRTGATVSNSSSMRKEIETSRRTNEKRGTVMTYTCTTLPQNIPSAENYRNSSSSSATTSPTASSTSSSYSHTESHMSEITSHLNRSDPTKTSTATTNSDSNSQHNNQRRAIISKSRSGGVVKKCIDSLSSKDLLHPTPMFVTGAGYKTMKLVLGEENEALWFFPRPGTSLWDVAAADALLRAMGGRITDKFGKDLDYGRCVDVAKVKGSHPRLEAENEDGIIACCDLELHAKCLQLYKDENWDFGCD